MNRIIRHQRGYRAEVRNWPLPIWIPLCVPAGDWYGIAMDFASEEEAANAILEYRKQEPSGVVREW